MNTYRITIYNEISKKKKHINVQAPNIENATRIASYNNVHHPSEEMIKIERWDDKK